MQTEPLLTELASNGHTAGSAPTKNAAADAAPSRIAQEFKNFVADMEDLIKASTSLTGDDFARAKANVYARVATARVFLEEIPGEISDRARQSILISLLLLLSGAISTTPDDNEQHDDRQNATNKSNHGIHFCSPIFL